MEESSEKRRQRIQALRSEAASNQQSSLLSPCSASSSTPLENPMTTNSNSNDSSPQLSRFDFYTDPMAAYSGAKRRDSFSSPIRSPSPRLFPPNRPNAGPRNYHVTPTHPPSPHQFQMNQSPNHSSYPPPIHKFQMNPSPNQSPYPPQHQFQMNQPPNQSPWRSPVQFSTPYSTHGGGTPPHYAPNSNYLNNSGGGSPHCAFPPNYSASRGGGLLSPSSPSFRHVGSHSPHSNSGRGTGWKSRGSGRSGGRDRGFYHDQRSGRFEASHFYLKTMVKDPWRKLKPIVGNILFPLSGSGSWHPKSIAAAPKRARVVESGAKKSQLSLAESLALAMEEAVDTE